jgi:hypothetical protein
MPPLQPVDTPENLSSLDQQSSTESTNLYPGWGSKLSRNWNSLNIKKDRSIPETEVQDIKAGLFLKVLFYRMFLFIY